MTTHDNRYVKAKIISVGIVETAEDGYTPHLKYWNVSYEGIPPEQQAPAIDQERRCCWGWPIHELAAIAAHNMHGASYAR